jgi:hypothetical protein
MSRLDLLTRFREASLKVLAEDCNRLRMLVREELSEIRRAFQPLWYRRTDRAVVIPSTTPVVQVKFGEVIFIDTTNGDVEFYLPMATEKDAFRSVGFIKRTSLNNVIVRTVPPGRVQEVETLTVSQRTGLTVLSWDGVQDWWWHRG